MTGPDASRSRPGGEVGAGVPRVLIWPGRAVYVGPLLENEPHAHHAIQVTAAIDGELSVQTSPSGRWATAVAIATAPDRPHRIRCAGTVVQLYVDPESQAGRALLRRTGAAVLWPLGDADARSLVAATRDAGGSDPDAVYRAADELARTAPEGCADTPIDQRVQKALELLHEAPGRHIALGDLAAAVALSPSRLGALFRRETGVPVRRYLLWLRLIDAVEALSAGMSLTEAAHEAGFADSAHLSRTFRRMFGMPPSALRSVHVEVHPAPVRAAALAPDPDDPPA